MKWCQTFTQALMCPRDKNFVEVDKKIYWVQDVIHPLLSHSAQRKNITKKMIRKTSDLVWGLNLGIHACQKNCHFDIGGVYILHRGT